MADGTRVVVRWQSGIIRRGWHIRIVEPSLGVDYEFQPRIHTRREDQAQLEAALIRIYGVPVEYDLTVK